MTDKRQGTEYVAAGDRLANAVRLLQLRVKALGGKATVSDEWALRQWKALRHSDGPGAGESMES